MVPEIIIVGFALGLLLRGKLSRLLDVKIAHAWILGIPVAFLAVTSVVYHTQGIQDDNAWGFRAMHIGGFVALLVLAALNRRVAGVKIVLVGLVVNMVATAANGGSMPVARAAILRALGNGVLLEMASSNPSRHMLMTPGTKLRVLCDIVPACKPYVIWTSVYSIGDIVSSIGCLIAIIALMRTPLHSEQKAALEEQ